VTDLTESRVLTDILVVGGGIAGGMAAIRAAELGADVVVAEKGHTRRSGCAATGVDHILTYVPEFHGSRGYTINDFINDLLVEGRVLRVESLSRLL